MRLRPSTQLAQDGAADGQAWKYDAASDSYVPYTPGSGGGGSSGMPLGLSGATASTRYVGGTVSGPPTSGTFAIGDFIVAQDGYTWICVSAGTPGGWLRSDGVYWKDRFNRANNASSPGAGYAADAGTWGITGGQLYCSAAVGNGALVHDLGISDNYVVDFDVVLGTGSDIGLWFRYSDINNALLLAINPAASVTLFKRVAGTFTSVATGAAPQSGDHYQIVVSSTSITVYRIRSGTTTTQITAAESSNISGTKIGARSNGDTVSRWDNLIVTRND